MNLAAQIWLYVKNMMGPVLASAGTRLQGWGSKISTEFNKVAGRTFGVAQAFTFIKGSMEESLNRAKQFVNLGKRMGLPADQVAQLERYSEMAGINVVSLGRGMTSLQKNAGQALSDMNSKMGTVARSLGLTKEQLVKVRGGGMEAFIEIRRAMEVIPSQGDRAQIWIQLLGERFTELRDFVGMTAEEMEQMMEGQIAMGPTTIESVGETQKAWGNMFADLSVLFAEFVRDAEPVVGVLRFILNILMMISRVVMVIFGVIMTLIQLTLNGLRMIGGLIAGIMTGDWAMLKDSLKQGNKIWKDGVQKMRDTGKGLVRDYEGMTKGMDQLVGKRPSIDMPTKREQEALKEDRRTLADVHEYNMAMRNQEAIDRKREDSLLVDEAKIDNLKKIVELEEHQAELIKEKYGINYKETKEYLEYLNKREDKLKEIAKLEFDLAQKRYDTAVSWIDLANEYYLKEMEITYKSEAEMREERARQAVDKIELMQRELERMQQQKGYYSEADIAKQQQEIYKLAQDTSLMLRKPIDNLDYKADSLQAVGGGGAVSSAAVSIAKAQLMQQQESNKWLQILANQALQSGSLGAIYNAGIYARNVGGASR